MQLLNKTGRTSASAFLETLIAAVAYKIHTVRTGNGIQFTFPPRDADGPTARSIDAHARHALPREQNRAPADQDQASLDRRAGRTPEPDDQKSHRQKATITTGTASAKITSPFINADNYARRLNTLKGLTPYAYIGKIWTEPQKVDAAALIASGIVACRA